ILDWRNRQGDIDPCAVFADALRLKVSHQLAAADRLDDPRHLIHSIGRRENGDRPAPRFILGVTKHSLRCFVPSDDRSVELLANDRIVGRLNDGCKLGVGLLSPAGWPVSFLSKLLALAHSAVRSRPRASIS